MMNGPPPAVPPQLQGGPAPAPPPPTPPPPPQAAPSVIPRNTGTTTNQPKDATMRFVSGAKKRLTDAQWTALSNDLYQSVLTSIAARAPLERNLREWSDAYDMIIVEKDEPFVNSANTMVPYIASQLDALTAYIAGTVLQRGLYIVTGRTTAANQLAPQVEKFYNAELVRQRADGKAYYDHYISLLRMGLRDGTAVMEELWARDRRRLLSETYTPVFDSETGTWKMNPDGSSMFETNRQEVDVYIKDYAQQTPLGLKDFGLIPTESLSIEEAAACWRTEWLYEDELNRRVRAGTFDAAEVERALIYVPMGMSEVGSDPQGVYDKSASQQIAIGLAQGSMSSEFFKNRGPINVKRIHSRQFDMNGDGIPEENIFWLHYPDQRLLGWVPYDYADGKRPFFSYSPFPRSDRFYGYSLIERLAGVQTDIDASRNERRDAISQRLQPPMFVQSGSELLNQEGVWGAGKINEVETPGGPNPSFVIPTMPDIPLSSFQDQSNTQSYGDDFTGLGNPALGVQGPGRRSATEQRSRSQAQGTRLELLCKMFRITLIQIVNFQHSLNKQYLNKTPETTVNGQPFTLPPEALMQDYDISVAGASDPIDSITRRNENMQFVDLMMKLFPWINQDPMRSWYVARVLCDAFARPDTQQLIGTEDEAKQRAQRQAQQQKEQMDLQKQMAQVQLAHAAQGGGAPAKPGGPHPPGR